VAEDAGTDTTTEPEVENASADSQDAGARTAGEVGFAERAFLMGVGAALFAKEKAEELADELVRRGQISQAESESFAGRLANRADQTATSAQKAVADETAKVVQRMGLVSKRDLAEVHDELTEIKAMIASLRPVEGGTTQS
jgi:polyhydroxyalkanoate synthesis regulator phasin